MTKFAALGFALAVLGSSAMAQSAVPAGYLPLDKYDAERSNIVPKTPASGLFEAVRGASLHATLDRWAKASGWQEVVWQLPPETDFTLGASARFEGDFLSSTKALIQALGDEANLRARFHHANLVLVVEAVQ